MGSGSGRFIAITIITIYQQIYKIIVYGPTYRRAATLMSACYFRNVLLDNDDDDHNSWIVNRFAIPFVRCRFYLTSFFLLFFRKEIIKSGIIFN